MKEVIPSCLKIKMTWYICKGILKIKNQKKTTFELVKSRFWYLFKSFNYV